jgi:hypothetical protein
MGAKAAFCRLYAPFLWPLQAGTGNESSWQKPASLKIAQNGNEFDCQPFGLKVIPK